MLLKNGFIWWFGLIKTHLCLLYLRLKLSQNWFVHNHFFSNSIKHFFFGVQMVRLNQNQSASFYFYFDYSLLSAVAYLFLLASLSINTIISDKFSWVIIEPKRKLQRFRGVKCHHILFMRSAINLQWHPPQSARYTHPLLMRTLFFGRYLTKWDLPTWTFNLSFLI